MVAAAVVGGAVIGGVGTAIGSGEQASAAQNAAQDQEQANASAEQLQQQEFNTVQSETAPQRNLGYGASSLLANLWGLPNPQTGAPAGAPDYSGFNSSPGYKFAVQQANQAINRQAAAGGNLYSTNTLQTIGANNAGYASQQYNNYINQLMTAAGLGNAATSTATGAGTTLAGNEGNLASASGAAAAAGAYNVGSAINTEISGLTNPNSGLLSAYGAATPPGYASPYQSSGTDQFGAPLTPATAFSAGGDAPIVYPTGD